jgi:hypothetical protein
MNSGVPDGDGSQMCPVPNHAKMMADAYDNAWKPLVLPSP